MSGGSENTKVEHLETLLRAHWNDEPALQELLKAIQGRVDKDVRDLRGRILRRLAGLHSATHIQQSDVSARVPRMRAPGTSGLPPAPREQTKTRPEHDLPSGTDRCSRYAAALEALIKAQRTSSRRRRREVRNGVRSRHTGTAAVYTFEVASQTGIFDGTDIDLEVLGQRTAGTVLSLQPGQVVLSSEKDLGQRVERAVLLFDDTRLLKQLCEKLRAAARGEVELNRTLADIALGASGALPRIAEIPDPGPVLPLNESQAEARRRVLGQPVTFIWGPPGCGKTYTLSDVVRTMFDAGKRTLICSSTNKAVDQLLLGICRTLGPDHNSLREGHVVRLGDIADDKLSAEFNEQISLEAIVSRRTAALRAQIAQLSALKSAAEQEIRILEPLLDRFCDLDNIRAELAELDHDLEAASRLHAKLRADAQACDLRLAGLARKLRQAEGLLRVLHGSPSRIRENMVIEARGRASLEPQLDEVETGFRVLTQRRSHAAEQRESLEQDLQDLDRNTLVRQAAQARQQVADLADQIRDIEGDMADLAATVVSDARVLGTTGTRAYLSVELIGPVDLVIVDEASMMLVPLVWFVAGMSRERVVLCGDFRQLPPILQSEDPAVLNVIGGDVFQASGVSGLDPNDCRIVMLDTQRRMDEEICALISGPMYGGRLRTATDLAFRKDRTDRRRPAAPFDHALTLIDTSELRPIETYDDSSSRLNTMHALLVRNLAWHLREQGYLESREDLGVCTPYAAQTRLIRKLLEGESLTDVQVGTVHAFQGDERNAIVLEIPESEGSSKLGRFVTGVAPDDTGARLINVAVSRAQNHLIVIANLEHLDRLLPSSALLRSVLYQMELRGRVISGKQLLGIGPLEKDLQGLEEVDLSEAARARGLFNQHDFDGAFAVDIGRSRENVAIFSGFVSHNRVEELKGLFGESVQSGVKVRCISKPPHSNSNRPMLGKRALDALEELGCTVDGREWIHQKVILIDGQIVWQGSLNPLSYSQRTEEIMVRLVNADFARLVAAALAKKPVPFSKVLEKVAEPENPRCGACGSRTYYHVQRRIELFTCEDRCGWSVPLADPQEANGSSLGLHSKPDDLPATGQSCPQCGAQTVKRTGPFGPFYGCSRFPQCRGKWAPREMPPSN